MEPQLNRIILSIYDHKFLFSFPSYFQELHICLHIYWTFIHHSILNKGANLLLSQIFSLDILLPLSNFYMQNRKYTGNCQANQTYDLTFLVLSSLDRLEKYGNRIKLLQIYWTKYKDNLLLCWQDNCELLHSKSMH